MKLVIIAMSFVLVSCNSQKKAAMKEETSEKSKSENRLELIMQEEQGGFDTDQILVVRDAKRLKSFFSKINRTRKPGLPVPDVDFLNHMVIIHCIGEGSFNNSVMLSVLKETDTQVILNAKGFSDSKDASKANSYGSFCIYKLPITVKEIILEKHPK